MPWLSRIRARFDIAVSTIFPPFKASIFFQTRQNITKNSYQSFFVTIFALSQVEREKSNSEIARNVTREQVKKISPQWKSKTEKKFSQDVLTSLTDCFVFEII